MNGRREGTLKVVKRLFISLVALGVLGVLGFGALAWRPAIAPIAPPGSFALQLVAKGEALAGGGYCAECHTVKGGQHFAGGYAMPTPFGVLYSTNITPDPETGIGTWSEPAFARAMREGVARDGSHLFPAFPYYHFTKLSDDDVRALYAYFMTRASVRAPARTNELAFPLNIRYLARGVEAAVLQVRPLRTGRRQDRRMEPRRLPRARVEPLRRLPHAAQLARCRKGG
jgi:mono/diheme cytochrome c family protein